MELSFHHRFTRPVPKASRGQRSSTFHGRSARAPNKSPTMPVRGKSITKQCKALHSYIKHHSLFIIIYVFYVN